MVKTFLLYIYIKNINIQLQPPVFLLHLINYRYYAHYYGMKIDKDYDLQFFLLNAIILFTLQYLVVIFLCQPKFVFINLCVRVHFCPEV